MQYTETNLINIHQYLKIETKIMQYTETKIMQYTETNLINICQYLKIEGKIAAIELMIVM
jgi:hypothetical protein